jgi:Mlc titration factor MtfA (ptsG expression regulator)
MPARLLSIPFIIGALVYLFLAWEVHEDYSYYIAPFVIVLAVILVLSPQINWWWYKRFTPRLDPRLALMLQQHMPYYQQLTPENKKQFRDRVFLYIEGHDFSAQAMDDVPEDVKLVIAASAVQLTFGFDDFLLDRFEKIIIYPKPFPSPQYPRNFHASEIYEEDGVILYAAEHLMLGFMQPKQYYNIALHELVKAFRVQYPNIEFPELPDDIWEKMETVSGFSKEAIHRWINLEGLSPIPISIVHFFMYPQAFQAVLPDLFELYTRLFRQNPLLETQPRLKSSNG